MKRASHKVFGTSLLILLAVATQAPTLAADRIEPLTGFDKRPYSPRPFMGPEITPLHEAAVPPKAVSKNLIDQISKVKNELPFRHGMHHMAP